MKGKKTMKLRWYEAFAPSAQMFHGAGKGMGRGRGPRLAEAPASGTDKDSDRVRRDGLVSV